MRSLKSLQNLCISFYLLRVRVRVRVACVACVLVCCHMCHMGARTRTRSQGLRLQVCASVCPHFNGLPRKMAQKNAPEIYALHKEPQILKQSNAKRDSRPKMARNGIEWDARERIEVKWTKVKCEIEFVVECDSECHSNCTRGNGSGSSQFSAHFADIKLIMHLPRRRRRRRFFA